MEEALPGFPIEIDLGPRNGGKVFFRTAEEVESWLGVEEAFWQWFPQGSNDFESQYRGAFKRIRESIDRYRHVSNKLGEANDLRTNFHQSFGRETYFHSSRPEARFLQEFGRTDQSAASCAWAYLAGFHQMPTGDARHVAKGITRAVLYELGVSDLAESQKAALDGVLSDGQREVEALRGQQAALAESGKALREQFEADGKAEIERAKTVAEDALKSFRQEGTGHIDTYAELLRNGAADLKALTETYDKHMALRAAVDYWGKRQQGHVWRAMGFGAATVIAGVLGFEIIYRFAFSVFAEKSAADKPHYWEVGAVLLLTTLVLWVVRIFARVLVGNLHLELDAGERRVMVQTYLALLREGALPDDKAKALVLGPLFRRSSGGLIKEDGAVSLLDFVTRIPQGK